MNARFCSRSVDLASQIIHHGSRLPGYLIVEKFLARRELATRDKH
jgi:hypothetical protein